MTTHGKFARLAHYSCKFGMASQKWPLANVSESGESKQNRLANVGESGESEQNRLANVSKFSDSEQTRLADVGESGESDTFQKRAIWAITRICQIR